MPFFLSCTVKSLVGLIAFIVPDTFKVRLPANGVAELYVKSLPLPVMVKLPAVNISNSTFPAAEV